ncbi:hypothetical protein [Polyangium jinanense]|uniref:Uncharacterized protein n=1 Tax=Polyangium jinanense TaxID=2829994 RepID=A0A9X4AWT0_9BACT|nr:hypothetical protein [Polyangium jinanense]MDC3959730.1 hypothetical protein [Polyangium jinanense]MDC3987634.1 hypothetical protein [Polyangium jinanense]
MATDRCTNTIATRQDLAASGRLYNEMSEEHFAAATRTPDVHHVEV